MNVKTKTTGLEVLKWLLVLGLLVFLFFKTSGNASSAAPFETVSAAVTAATDLSTVQQADNQMVKRLYGLDPGSYEGLILYSPTSNMGSEELLLVKLADLSQQEAVKAAIEARVATQMNAFEGYAVEQYEMLQNCVIEVHGNYILFVSAADTSPTRQAFLDAL